MESCGNVRFKEIQGSDSLIWHAFTFCEADVKLMVQLVVELSLKTGETCYRWLRTWSSLQCRTWWKDQAETIEQQIRARGIDISQDQLLGEEEYVNVERQYLYDVHTRTLCHAAALNA